MFHYGSEKKTLKVWASSFQKEPLLVLVRITSVFTLSMEGGILSNLTVCATSGPVTTATDLSNPYTNSSSVAAAILVPFFALILSGFAFYLYKHRWALPSLEIWERAEKNTNVPLWRGPHIFKRCDWFDVLLKNPFLYVWSINSELEVEEFTEGSYSENQLWDVLFYYFTVDAKGARFVRKTATSPFRGGYRYMNVPNIWPDATPIIWSRL